jgi:hypothetical protein
MKGGTRPPNKPLWAGRTLLAKQLIEKSNRCIAAGGPIRMERELLNSKFKVGQLVEFRPVRASLPASSREYKILRLLPREGVEQQYRIKSVSEIYERIAKESELSRRT